MFSILETLPKEGEDKLFVVQESAAAYGRSKPVICPKCENGKLGYIPKRSEALISRRGTPPPDERDEGVQIKCPVCRKLWTITIK